MAQLPKVYYTRDQIAQHNTEYDYWIVMGNSVFEFKNFRHPGGWIMHAPFAGGKLDASQAFALKHGSSQSVQRSLANHFKGYVVENGDATISDRTFNQRWQQNGKGWPNNILGYGAENPWLPPLKEPKTLLGVIDRHEMIRFTGGPLIYMSMFTFWEILFNLGNGDAWDGFWYNNSRAVGMQLYPQGIHKYFDMFSWMGLWTFTIEWLLITTWDLLMPFTLLIPIDVWIAIFSTSHIGIERWFLWYFPWAFGLNTLFALIFDYPSEDGWGMLWN